MWRRSGGVFLPASARRQRRPTPTTAPLVVAAVAKLSTTTTTVRPPVAAVAGERQQWPRRRCHHHHYHDQHHDHHTNTAGSRRCFSFFEDVGNGSEETLRRTTTTNPTTINTNTKTNTNTTPRMGTAVYTLYGETCAFSVKAIPPEFRAISPSGLLVLDAHKRGRFLFEWTPAVPPPNRSATTTTTPNSTSTTTKTTYQWSATTRLALTVEEAGSLLARVDRGDPTVTFQRRIPSSTNSTNSADDGNHTKSTIIDKICIATRIEIPSMTSPSTAATEATTPPPPPHTRVMDGLSLLVDYIYPDGEGAEVEGKGRERDQQGLVRHRVVVSLSEREYEPGFFTHLFFLSFSPSNKTTTTTTPTIYSSQQPITLFAKNFWPGRLRLLSRGTQRGPFEIRLTVGDYAVFRSILEMSIPHLAGWSLMLEHQLAQSVHQHRRNTSSSHSSNPSSSRNMATRTPPPPPSTPKTNTNTTGNATERNSGGLSYDPTSPHNYN